MDKTQQSSKWRRKSGSIVCNDHDYNKEGVPWKEIVPYNAGFSRYYHRYSMCTMYIIVITLLDVNFLDCWNFTLCFYSLKKNSFGCKIIFCTWPWLWLNKKNIITDFIATFCGDERGKLGGWPTASCNEHVILLSKVVLSCSEVIPSVSNQLLVGLTTASHPCLCLCRCCTWPHVWRRRCTSGVWARVNWRCRTSRCLCSSPLRNSSNRNSTNC